jgi:putative Mg2+ transporter-C (MgtC) family protein
MLEVIAPPHTLWEIVSRLLIAAGLGAAVGFNRELLGKPAGLRTHALVSLGAAQITLVTMLFGAASSDSAAVGRVLQGIVAGVGFIGGGVIMRRPDPKGVHGLTTAATIWTVAATGITAGMGLWRTATAGMLIVLLVLSAGGQVDRLVHRGDPGAVDE